MIPAGFLVEIKKLVVALLNYLVNEVSTSVEEIASGSLPSSTNKYWE